MSIPLIEDLIYDFYNMGNNPMVKQLVERFYRIYEDDIAEQNPEQDNLNDDVEADDGNFLDNIINGKDVDMKEIIRANVPSIYAFVTEHVPNMIKIGYTDQGVMTRLKQWQRHYKDAILIGHWTAVEFNIAKEKVFFKDYPVHTRVAKANYARITDSEKEAFKQLSVNKDLVDMHVSSEFFHKYKNINQEQAEELSKVIIEDIINELKKDIRENNNLTNVILYKLLADNGTNKADTPWPIKHPDFKPTGLQNECIKNGLTAIKDGKTDLLMSAVMRAGKTFMTYSIINQSDELNYILVASAKADVRSAWRDEINHNDFYKKFVFIEFISKPDVIQLSSFEEDKNCITTKNNILIYDKSGKHVIERELEKGHKVIVFASLQDLAGELSESEYMDFNMPLNEDKKNSRTIKEQHQYLFNHAPDMVVIDETHYGSHSDVYGAAMGLSKMNKDEYSNKERAEAKKEVEDAEKYDNVITKINAKYRLQCSGTPYYILQSGEFAKAYSHKTIITNTSFTDMLNARDEWAAAHTEEEQSDSPYYGVPDIIKYGMQLTKKCQLALAEEGQSTNLTELFRINDNWEFVHKDAIIELMTAIFGKEDNNSIGFLNKKEIINGNIFKHCIMVLPRIDACTVLQNLLRDEHIIDENERKTIVLVEKRTKNIEGGRRGDVQTVGELNDTLNKLESEGKHSLMITVNRFMTGVSIPLADSMLYMKSTKSPQDYDQTVFRLTTRNVKKYIDENGKEKKINMKPNVYLIDFDINRMYEMTVQSAVQQCAAKGLYDPDDIQKAIEEQLDTIPMYIDDNFGKKQVYDENGNKILKGMHAMKTEDLMMKYINYNANKDIQSSIDDMMDQKAFDVFLNNADNLEIVRNFDKGSVERIGLDPKAGEDEIDIEKSSDEKKKDKSDNEGGIKNETSADLKELKERFIGMLKNILYCNICLEEPVDCLDKFVDAIQTEKNKELAKCFKIDIEGLNEVLKVLSSYEKGRINVLLIYLYKQLNDESLKPEDRALNAIKKMGRLDDKKSEDKSVALVVTPPELVDKMINKVPDEVFKNADSILEVNSKTCEFMIGLYKKFGIDVAKRVKIVPGDLRCRAFIRRILNLMGISEYNIIDIDDLNGDGKYDVKDFLDIKNEDLIRMNKNGKKFDCILANPPFNIGEKMLIKYFDIADNIMTVQPSTWLTGKKKTKGICQRLDSGEFFADIESINGNEFFDAAIGGQMAIQFFTKNKDYNRVYDKFEETQKSIIFDHKEYDNTNDISMTSNDPLLEEFKSIVKPLYEKDNLFNHLKNIPGALHFNKHTEYNPNDNWWCMRMQGMRGHKGTYDFYTIISNDSNELKKLQGIYKIMSNKKIIPTNKGNDAIEKPYMEFYYAFNTQFELLNFINYVKTDFCRICLFLRKSTMDLTSGKPIAGIPWFDFSDNIFSKSPYEIDNYLFKKYNISSEIRHHIENLLPDYYNIRKDQNYDNNEPKVGDTIELWNGKRQIFDGDTPVTAICKDPKLFVGYDGKEGSKSGLALYYLRKFSNYAGVSINGNKYWKYNGKFLRVE